MATGSVCPNQGLRGSWRRRKSCVLGVSFLLLCVYVWAQYVEMDGSFSPLRPLMNAESEARRLLAILTHYNYQCNVTLSQAGNTTLWPLCASREIGFSSDDKKVAYTVGTLPDYSLEKSLAANFSFEVFILARDRLPPLLSQINNTHVIRTAVVPNDPADFSRNSYAQRTFNDILEAQDRATERIDLLRLVSVSSDSGSVQMWELVHFLISDGVLLNVNQLHLLVYIEKLDEDYLYNWYRTLYELFTKSGLSLYHTSSQDPLCLQVTLMQSCIYFLTFVRNPGPHVFSMYPPANFGTNEQEWLRLVDYINTIQVDCTGHLPDNRLQPEGLWTSCVEKHVTKKCKLVQFRMRSAAAIPSLTNGCHVIRVVPVLQDLPENPISGYVLQTDSSGAFRKAKLLTVDKTWEEIHSYGLLSAVSIDVLGFEWSVVDRLLSSSVIQNVTQLVMTVQLPEAEQVDAIDLRNIYSQLRRIGSVGFKLFLSQELDLCHSNNRLVKDGKCFRLGYLRSRL